METRTTQTGEMLVERRSMTMMLAGSMAEGIAGIGAIVLSILGLSRIFPEIMLPIATIAVGAAMLFQGGATTSRFSSLLGTAAKGRMDISELGIGITIEFFGGAAGIVLGVLSLMGIYPMTLLPAAAIVYGSALLLGSRVTAHLNSEWIATTEEREIVRNVSQAAIAAASSVQLLIGLGAITLGILAITGMSPVTLILTAMLSMGFADILSGTTMMGRFSKIYRKHMGKS